VTIAQFCVIFVNYLDHIVNELYQCGKGTLPEQPPMRQCMGKD
jgi:hypothetical protein